MGLSLKKIGKAIGGVMKKAAPVVGLIPGVGTLAGAAIGAGGSVLSGNNLKSHLKHGAIGGISGAAGGLLKGSGGASSILSKIPGGGSLGKGIGGLMSGSLGGGIKAVGTWAKNNPDAILGGLSAIQGQQASRRADGMMDRAMNDPGLNAGRPDFSDSFSGYNNAYTGAPNPYGVEARTPQPVASMADYEAPFRAIGRGSGRALRGDGRTRTA